MLRPPLSDCAKFAITQLQELGKILNQDHMKKKIPGRDGFYLHSHVVDLLIASFISKIEEDEV